ncbi:MULTISPECIES: adenosylmethionine decarboxylase [unclassified Thermoplasma]|uniref:adenosylmethionine decarboxylase n=1 Tax=unclassified Thermoplasma TaxID=2684908 RepID=UPI000D9ED932|nr:MULTISPECIES: adenosylmethionine decarboxylase [unclassified Thermoplasma]PYB67848.1 S-adenosylmethionine decarboxylase [Thermoplasma sp. Kam2015]
MEVGVGIHIIADFYGVDSELIATTERMFPIIEGAVEYGRLTKISSDYYQFRPRGASGIVLLAESHLSFHTWPEYGLVTLDIYTCGDPKTADDAFAYLVDKLRPTSISTRKIIRGDMIEEAGENQIEEAAFH